jgi:RimJ/RimL family protein N-acetyltransferase
MTARTTSDIPLSTGRLAVRAPRPEDAGELARLVNDAGVARMTTSIPHPYPADAAGAFLERMAEADARRERLFAVEVREQGFAGLLGFHPAPDSAWADAVEVGYWLGRPYWGQGYMTEALTAALVWAGGHWGRRFVLAGHFADNPASGQVLVKAGFLYTGEVVTRYSLARREDASTRMMVWLA